jgi:phospholipid transport system substrate-binding protein
VFKKLLLTVILVLSSPLSWAQEEAVNPYELVESVANSTFTRMNEEWVSQKEDTELLKAIIREELLPHVDYQFAAFKVLGKNFKGIPKPKLKEYVDAFSEYLVTSYSVALGYYDNQTVVFEPAKDVNNKSFVVVRGVIKGNDGPDINIAFKVRESGKTKQWKAYDLVAEGISLVDSKRAEFGAVLRNGDIDDVLEIMKKSSESKTLALVTEE